MSSEVQCRACGAPLRETFVDLGSSPLSNGYLREEEREAMEPTFPLHARVCGACFLVQVPEFEAPERIFSGDYAYFSSFSDSWLAHAKRYVLHATERLGLDASSHVVEVASNDGYLLQYFVDRNVSVHGIEPALNVAEAARSRGVPTETFFLGSRTASKFVDEFGAADLVAANNVMAHVPDLHDFVSGLATLLKPEGVLTVEFPHLLELIGQVQFDTIYHEHFSYLSLFALEPVLAEHGLRVFDVDRLTTHGGSLRIWVAKTAASFKETERVQERRASERDAGLANLDVYRSFSARVHAVKRGLLRFLIEANEAGRVVAGYGAAAKGNTLLNYCGVRADMIPYVVDRNPAKAGRWMPGSRIPIDTPDRILRDKPHYVLILPWNIKEEVMEQMGEIREYGGRFVVAIPELTIL